MDEFISRYVKTFIDIEMMVDYGFYKEFKIDHNIPPIPEQIIIYCGTDHLGLNILRIYYKYGILQYYILICPKTGKIVLNNRYKYMAAFYINFFSDMVDNIKITNETLLRKNS